MERLGLSCSRGDAVDRFTQSAPRASPARPGSTELGGARARRPRSDETRLDQIVAWLAGGDETPRHAFDGVVVFDEAHAMANAAGDTRRSQQGLAGLRLQHACRTRRVLNHHGPDRRRVKALHPVLPKLQSPSC